MDPLLSLVILLSGYLIGSVSFARIVGKLVLPGDDLERSTVQVRGTSEYVSFRSVSATTIRARAGARYGVLTSLLDGLKAAIPIAITLCFLDSQAYAYLLSGSVILGHDFPVYYKFRGGRGVSCLLGSLMFFDWASIPTTLVISVAVGLFVIDDAFIAYLSMPAYLVPWALATTGLNQFLVYAIAVNLIYWTALIPEVREHLRFRSTKAYEVAKKARHEQTRKRLSEILAKLRIRKP